MPVVEWKEYETKSPAGHVFSEWEKKHADCNVWVLLNDYVVIDPDSEEAERFVQSLNLPPCPTSISGNRSIHRWFKRSSPLKSLKIEVPSSNGTGEISIEVRTGFMGMLAPPSVHPETKKFYRWAKGLSPSDLDSPELPREAYEKIAALLGDGAKKPWEADSYAEGTRDDFLFRFASSLRAKSVPYDEAERLVLEKAENCDPKFSEKEARKCLKSAYRYPEGVTIPKEVIEMNKTWFVSTLGGKTSVFREIRTPGDKIVLEEFFPADFKNLYKNQTVAVGKKTKPLGDFWFDHAARRQYLDGVVFDPRSTCGDDAYNLWRGFTVEPKPGGWMLKEHLTDNLCGRDEVLIDYLLNWMARAVQHPDLHGEVATVLRGDRGTGKTIFGSLFGKLFGPAYLHLSRGDQLTGRFNDHLRDCVFLFADEAFYAGTKSEIGQLKRIITEKTLSIEGKFKRIKEVPNRIHLVMASNEYWVIPAGLDERRFFVLNVLNDRAQDTAYFGEIVRQMEGGGYEAMLCELLDRNIEGWNHRDVPNTVGLREQKIFNMDPPHLWWFGLLKRGRTPSYWDKNEQKMLYHVEWKAVSIYDLCRDYEEFAKRRGSRHALSAEQLGLLLKKLLPPNFIKERKRSKDKKRPRTYFTPLKDCRKHFETISRMEGYDWPDPAEDKADVEPF